MGKILAAVACNLDAGILSASLPLLEEERVEAIEWAFDALYQVAQVPAWFEELLMTFSNESRLIGHGVFFSLFSGRLSQAQKDWLQQLRQISQKYHFDHITEHFGFMTGHDFHNGAPLTIPYTPATLAIGRDRLARIQDACQCPVGLENLAFSYSVEEVKQHGIFLNELVEPVNGFIILDLHNLYCQLHNFGLGYEELIALYPLDRVREIHISGGSWEESAIDPGRRIRRDTHDNSTPDEVFHLLKQTLGRCPNLKYVVMEQLGTGLATAEQQRRFYDDFRTMEAIIQQHEAPPLQQANLFLPSLLPNLDHIAEDEQLYRQQRILSSILEHTGSYEEAMEQLRCSELAHSPWKIEQWQPYMLETAVHITHKWNKS